MREELVFAIYMSPKGPRLDCKLDPRFALRLLAGVTEDMREQIAVAAAKLAIEGERRIEVVPANGVIVGKSE